MSLLQAIHHKSHAEPVDGAPSGSVTLESSARHRRRGRMTTDQGEDFVLNLPAAIFLVDQDRLGLEDGRWLLVRAAPEPIYEVRHQSQGQLIRLAWHLGNRHLPTQICGDGLRIRRDHVIRSMLLGLGAEVTDIEAPFQPEGGAYSGAGTHAHSHGDGHSRGDGHGRGDHEA